jgi:heptosyltransferase-2
MPAASSAVPGGGVPLRVRLPNWVGDACMALPALRELDARGAVLSLAARGWATDLLAGHGWPVLALPGGLRAGAAALRDAGGPRRGLLFTNSLSSAAVFRLAGIAAVGHRNEGRSLLLGRGVSRPEGLHEVEVFWRLAGAAAAWLSLPGWPAAPPPTLGLVLTDAHREAARVSLTAAGLAPGEPYAVLAPLAAGTAGGVPKLWPRFAELDAALRARGWATVVCPGPGEEAAARAAAPGARVLAGLKLGAYAATCTGARMTVANDSGPMHLAAAADAPVVGVFGPGDPARTGPWGARAGWVGGKGVWPSVAQVLDALDGVAARAASASSRPERPERP